MVYSGYIVIGAVRISRADVELQNAEDHQRAGRSVSAALIERERPSGQVPATVLAATPPRNGVETLVPIEVDRRAGSHRTRRVDRARRFARRVDQSECVAPIEFMRG